MAKSTQALLRGSWECGVYAGWFLFKKHASKRRTLEGTGVMRETGDQGKLTQVYYWVIQNKACLAYACKADIEALSLQKLEAWLIYDLSPFI